MGVFSMRFFRRRIGSKGAFFSGLMKHVAIGVMLCLVFFVVHTVVRKLDAARRLGKKDRDVAVQGGLRNAPCILALPMPSEAEANRVGHALVAERLAARVDVFSQYFLSSDREWRYCAVCGDCKRPLEVTEKTVGRFVYFIFRVAWTQILFDVDCRCG